MERDCHTVSRRTTRLQQQVNQLKDCWRVALVGHTNAGKLALPTLPAPITLTGRFHCATGCSKRWIPRPGSCPNPLQTVGRSWPSTRWGS